MRRLTDRTKQHVPTSIRKKSNTVREQPPRMCKNNNPKVNCDSAIGQHLVTNPEFTKTYTNDGFRRIGVNWPIIGTDRRIVHHIMCTRIWLYISVHLLVVIRRFIL